MIPSEYQSVFGTPQKNRISDNVPRLTPNGKTPVLASPSKSPSRRALIFPIPSPTKISPVRTPKGRAGLIAPARRTVSELNASAVKKAYRTKISSVLADEDDMYDNDDVLTKQDLAIANSIINGSRLEDEEFQPLYGEDVQPEIDSDDTSASDESSGSSDIETDEDVPEEEFILLGKGNKVKAENAKRGRPRKKVEDVTEEPREKRRRGRPSKHEKRVVEEAIKNPREESEENPEECPEEDAIEEPNVAPGGAEEPKDTVNTKRKIEETAEQRAEKRTRIRTERAVRESRRFNRQIQTRIEKAVVIDLLSESEQDDQSLKSRLQEGEEQEEDVEEREDFEEEYDDDSDEEAQIESEEDDVEEEATDDSDDEFVIKQKAPTTPGRRGRPRKHPISPSPSQSGSDSPYDTNKILSIFRKDDELLQIKSPFKSEPEKTKVLEPVIDYSLDFITDIESIPIVSGIPQTVAQEEESDKKTRLSTLPVPQLDSNGSLPEDYIKTYLKDIDWTKSKEGEALDDRSYFSQGTEGYFDQSSHRERHSVYSLSNSGINLEYPEFRSRTKLLSYIGKRQKDALKQEYKHLYAQWCFELSQGFNMCFYGVGSKIDLITDFATNYMISWFQDFYKFEDKDQPKVLVLNGYNPGCRLKDILEHLIKILVPESSASISRNMVEVFPSILKAVAKERGDHKCVYPKLFIIVHSIDSDALRDDRTQVQLSELAKIPEIKMICSFENVNAPLLWDSYKLENFKFVYHDITTYDQYTIETSYRDVFYIGKKKRTSSSRGARFVLGALNENSKKIYKILLDSQIERIQELNPKTAIQNNKGGIRNAIDFKTFHGKCKKEFVTSNEITFRSMLGEFVEHNMCKIVKDEAGTEKVYIPYPLADMFKILDYSFR